MTEPLFLTLDEVLGIHADQIRRYGGRAGLRDLGLLLGLNGQRLEADPEALYELIDGVATGSVDKAEVAVFLRLNSRSR